MSDLFDPHVGYPNQDKMGDYFDMVSDNSGAHLAWANTLNGEEDVYYSHITPEIPSVVSQNPELTFSVFPNPTGGRFVCITDGRQSQVEVFNELGVSVYSKSITKVRNEIDIASQSAGIYFLKITDEKGNSAVKRIIKE